MKLMLLVKVVQIIRIEPLFIPPRPASILIAAFQVRKDARILMICTMRILQKNGLNFCPSACVGTVDKPFFVMDDGSHVSPQLPNFHYLDSHYDHRAVPRLRLKT